jgi:GNAT superfamily N-acetyltransferase
MSASIIRFIDLPASQQTQVLQELRDIFFESSSKKEFASAAERESFFRKYFGIYLELYPMHIWIAHKEKVLGYCLGAPIFDQRILELQPHLEIFRDLMEFYPAHLHINLHHDARGQGLGALLLKALEDDLTNLKISGLHLMTAADARNRAFYQRLGYHHEESRSYQGAAILFMGKRL